MSVSSPGTLKYSAKEVLAVLAVDAGKDLWMRYVFSLEWMKEWGIKKR